MIKISELTNKEYLGTSGVGTNSYLIINYDTDAASEGDTDANPPVTYRVALDELGKALVNNLKLVQYGDNSSLETLSAGVSSYSTTNLGYYVSNTDTSVLSSAVTNIAYDTTNKKFIKTVRGSNTTDVVATSSLLSDMNLNVSNISGFGAGKTLSTLSETDGKISATFQDISITSSQVSDKSDAINSNGSTLATSKAVKDALDSLDITQITNTAGKTISTINEANGKVSATFQNISITSSQISDKGTAGNVATLDEYGHIPSAQLPSYVDDVLEYAALSSFPVSGEAGKIYVDLATNTSYRWGGSIYVKVASDLSLGETSLTAYRGDYGARAYAHAGASAQYTAAASGLYRVTVNTEGHVTATDAVQASDITGLLGTAAVKNVPTSGNAATTEVVMGDDTRLTDARNAADVYDWAKAATKPTYTASEVGSVEASLFETLLDNFDLQLAMPTQVTWNVDDNTNALSATVNTYANTSTVVIQKQNGANWITYDDGVRADNDHFRAQVTRSLTFNSKVYTTTAVVGNEYIEPATHTLTVNYKDENNNNLNTAVTSSIKAGQAYTVNALSIEHYTPDNATLTGTMPDSDLTLTFTYTRITHTLTINYQYEDTTTAETAYVETINEGDSYSVVSPTITGYTPDIAIVTGTMGDSNATITVTYTEDTEPEPEPEPGE